jgi:hypothetical protein
VDTDEQVPHHENILAGSRKSVRHSGVTAMDGGRQGYAGSSCRDGGRSGFLPSRGIIPSLEGRSTGREAVSE